MLNILYIFIISLYLGCTQIHTLNLVDQNYNNSPREIVWLQVAGLDEEHLAMLRFSYDNSKKVTSFETMPCIGKMWNYNFFEIRPKARNSFITQITGAKNIKNTCDDYEKKPFWKFFGLSDFHVGVIEVGSRKNESFEEAWSCGTKGKNFTEDMTLWRMYKSESTPTNKQFHYQENIPGEKQIYYDKSCENDTCYSTLFENTKSIYKRFKQSKDRILIIRNFSFRNYLKAGNILRAKDELSEIDKIINYFIQMQRLKKDLMVILTTAENIPIELPRKGREWIKFQKSGKNILFRNPSLMSSVFVSGPGAQNYCGFFEESELSKRILWEPDVQKIKFNLFN